MIPRRHTQEENTDSWLMSYADMITLLLCFFIIFVSVSEPKKDKLSAIAEGVHKKFGSVDLATPFQGVFRSLQAVVESKQVLKDVAVLKSDTSVEAELSTLAFYQPNSADFTPEKLDTLSGLVDALKHIDIDYQIIVEGHTDDVPVKSPLYPTNWELSSARADHMVRFLIDHGVPAGRLRATGYADSKPAVPNLDVNGHAIPENREKNQRVVIKLERAS